MASLVNFFHKDQTYKKLQNSNLVCTFCIMTFLIRKIKTAGIFMQSNPKIIKIPLIFLNLTQLRVDKKLFPLHQKKD